MYLRPYVWKVFSLIGNVGIRALVGCCRPKRIAAPSGLAHKLVAVVEPASRVVDEVVVPHPVQLPLVHVRYHVIEFNVVRDAYTRKIGPPDSYERF